MDDRPRAESMQNLETFCNPDHPSRSHLPSDVWVRILAVEHRAERTARSQFEDKGKARLGAFQHTEELDKVLVLEAATKPRLFENLRNRRQEWKGNGKVDAICEMLSLHLP